MNILDRVDSFNNADSSMGSEYEIEKGYLIESTHMVIHFNQYLWNTIKEDALKEQSQTGDLILFSHNIIVNDMNTRARSVLSTEWD